MARKALYPPSIKPGIPKLGSQPMGWSEVSFGDILEPVVRPAQLVDETEYQLVTAKRSRGGIVPRERLNGRDIKTNSQYFINEGDFLISKRQIIHGACGIVPASLDGAIVSGEYLPLRSKSGLYLEYIRWFSHTVYFQQTCFHASVGVDVEKMVFDDDEWLRHRLFLPPFNEQRAIAAILATWDRAIEQMTRLIEAKRRLKQGLMQQLLTEKRRFRGYSKPWRSVHLGDTGEVASGATPSTSKARNWGGGIPWITPSEITKLQSQFITSTERTLTAEGLASCATSLLPVDSLIVCTRASVGDCAINTVPMAINQGFKAIIPSNDYNVLYLYYSIYAMQNALMRVAAGSTFAEVPKSAFCNIEFKVPDRAEQDLIAAVLASVDRMITLAMQYHEKLHKQKQALMQKLLTGQVRVKVAQEA